jgi:hypothetical protein
MRSCSLEFMFWSLTAPSHTRDGARLEQLMALGVELRQRSSSHPSCRLQGTDTRQHRYGDPPYSVSVT